MCLNVFSYLTFRPLLLVYFPVFIKEVALVPGSPQRGKPGEQGYFFCLFYQNTKTIINWHTRTHTQYKGPLLPLQPSSASTLTHLSPLPHLGAYLLRCSEVEQKLGESQKRFQSKAIKEFITPLKAFLEIDVKGVIVSLQDFSLVLPIHCNRVAFKVPFFFSAWAEDTERETSRPGCQSIQG